MKKTIQIFSVSLLAGAMALVSCTSDLKPDIERVEQQQIDGDKKLEDTINQTAASLYEALNQTKNDLEAAKTELENAIAGKVSIATYEAALIEYSNRLSQIVNAQKTLDDEQNNALTDIYGKINDLKTYVDNQNASLKNYVDSEVSKLYSHISTKVTELHNYIDAEIAKLQAQIDILKARVQSIVFVPQYTDMKFGLPFSVVKDNAPTPHYAAAAVDTVRNIVYEVSPDSLAESLAKNAKEIFGFVIKDDLKTRAVATEPKLEILSAKGDNVTGEIEFVLKQSGFQPTKVTGDYEVDIDKYAISLGIIDAQRNIGIASAYTQAALAPSALITVDLNNVYRKVKACKDADGKVVATPNVAVNDYEGTKPENLEIKYTGDVSKAPSYKTAYKPSYKAVSSFQKDTVVLYENTYLAAWVKSVEGVTSGPYTYDQLDSLGYNIADYVQHSESEVIETAKAGYATTATLSGASAVVSAPVARAFSPISLYYDEATKASRMSARKNEVGKFVAKTITYKTGICDESFVTRTAKVDFIQADDIYFRFTLDTLKWTYAQDAPKDNALFKGNTTEYDRAFLKAIKIEASVDGGNTYSAFKEGTDAFWGVELKDFDKLTRQNYYTASETSDVDYESAKILNPVFKGSDKETATFINTYASYDPADKSLSFGNNSGAPKSNYAFYHRDALGQETYKLVSRATDPASAQTVNASAYCLPNAGGSQYIAAKSEFSVTTKDRKRDVIYITGETVAASQVPEYPATVTPTATTASLNRFDVLVNGNNSFTDHGSYLTTYQYFDGSSIQSVPVEHYEIKSGDIKEAVYAAFVKQGIFSPSEMATASLALSEEFNAGKLNPGTAYNAGSNSYFKLVNDNDALTLQSNGGYGRYEGSDKQNLLLTSERLKKQVRIYPDYNEKPFVEAGRFIEYVFFTYTGQEVHVIWSLGSIASASGTYEFRTKQEPEVVGSCDFAFIPNTTGYSIAPNWMYMSNLVGIYHSGSTEEIKKYDVNANYYYYGTTGQDTHLVPEFRLVHTENYTSTDMFGLYGSYYLLHADSNLLKYEGTSDSVDVAGQLWMYSGFTSTRFPVTSKIIVEGAKKDYITILKP